MRILVMCYGAVGDVLQTTPVLKAIKDRYPNSYIGYLVSASASTALYNNQHVDSVLLADHYGPWDIVNWKVMLKLARKIHGEHFDVALGMDGNFFYGLISYMAGINKRYGIAGKKRRAILLTNAVIIPDASKMVRQERQKMVLNFLGIDIPSNLMKPVISYTNKDKQIVEKLFSDNTGHKLIGLFANSGPNSFRPWAKRSWPLKNWIELMQNLSANNPDCCFVFFGRGQDGCINKELINSLKAIKYCDLTDKTTVPQLAYALSKCNLLVSTDSSPVFAAAAVGCPVVVLYGPEWPQRAQPVGAKTWRPVTVDMACREYCCSFPAKAPVCNNECMTNITVDMVYKEANNCLKN